jgi:hypothetical protein
VISVDTRGRMGNQMFQLAFAHAAARRLGTTFILGPGPLWDSFDLGPWGRRRVRLARKLAFRLRHGSNPPDRVEVDEQEDPDAVVGQLCDAVAYGGFFQSERYFAGYEDEIRALFRVRAEHERAFAARYGDLPPYVCVHLRRGDYREWHGGRALPTTYFTDALRSLGDLGGMPVVVISDEPESAATELAEFPGARVETNPAMVDFLLLMNASAVVASNSSFSWWGAWLNRTPGACVIVPEHWFGFADGVERPRGVLARGWTSMRVRDAPLAAAVMPSPGSEPGGPGPAAPRG